ncbi:hypothetical protein JCM5350_005788 [Sporobolomyces pararoseus]
MADFEDPLFTGTQDSSLWAAYSYAAAQQPSYTVVEEPTFTLPPTETGDNFETENLGVGHSSTARRGSMDMFAPYYQQEEVGDGLGFDSYLDPTMLVQPSSSSHNLHSHSVSPGLPPLSSADSTPSSSSALHTPYGPFDSSPPSAVGGGGILLPSAPIAAETSSSSRFAKLQESYLEHQHQPTTSFAHLEPQEEEQRFTAVVEPSSHALSFSTSAPPLTPSRRHNDPISSTQLWRSPSSHSVNSSPSKSPYAHSRAKPYDRPLEFSPTKLDFDSPTKTIVRRNFPTSQDDVQLSPTKGGRRQRANLSIDVPSKYGLRSRLPVIAASPQVPSTDGKFPGPQESLAPESELTESTLQQVENLLHEFGPMARSGAFDSAGSSSQSSSSVSSYGPSRGPSSSASNDTRYCISGVALSLEDMAQLDDPSLTAAFDSVTMHSYPASAPPHQTTFNLPEPPSPSPYHLTVPNSLHTTPLPTSTPSYIHDSSYSSQQQPNFERWSPSSYVASRSDAPFNSHVRSISAPRTAYYPTEDELAQLPLQPPISHSLVPTYSTHSLPSHSSPPGASPALLRRRSSIASGSPSTSSPWSQGPPRPQQTLHSYSYGPPPVSPSSAQHSPYHNIPLPLRPAPPPGTTFDISPPTSPTKQKSKAKAIPGPTPTSPTKSVQASPKKRKSGPRARNPSAMFVNFSAADAKKLLSGVAPSGSSKKKREEEEAAASAKLASNGRQSAPSTQVDPQPQQITAQAS